MLRRDFVKTSFLAFGGVLLMHSAFAMSPSAADGNEIIKKRRPVYHLHGHAHSGCASPPELMPMLEQGIMSLPM